MTGRFAEPSRTEASGSQNLARTGWLRFFGRLLPFLLLTFGRTALGILLFLLLLLFLLFLLLLLLLLPRLRLCFLFRT